jgi:hypothetical protein
MVKILVFITSLFLAAMHAGNLRTSILATREYAGFIAADPRRKGCLIGWRSLNALIASTCSAGAIVVWFNLVVGAILGLWPLALYLAMGLGLLVTGGWREIASGLRRGRDQRR